MTTEEMIQALEALLETLRAKPVLSTPEPDPWPTAPLIVADWIATGTAKGHGLLYLDGHEYVTIESGHVLRYGRDTLTNVVPVKPVPVAELDNLREMLALAESGDKHAWPAVKHNLHALLRATDALGLDQ